MATGTIHTATDPIAAILDFEGAGVDDYERLSERLRPTCRERKLRGCLYHWVKRYPDGFRVIEFWRGRDVFERFMSEELRPAARAVGLAEPRLTIEPVPAEILFEAEATE